MTESETVALLEAVPLPMLSIDRDGRVTATNRACVGLLGSGLVGRHFITAVRQPLLIESVESTLRSGVAGKGRFLSRDGQRDTTYLVHIAPVGGQVVLTFEDRTAAEEVSALRRDFVANVSHELRTPLTALNGFIETLQGPARNDPKARDRFLGVMARETARMTRLVGDLLSLSRVEENERVRPDEPVIVGDLIRTALAELDPIITTAGGQAKLIDDSGGAAVPGDAGQIRQVIGNLLENAAKYGVEGGQVRISLSKISYQQALRHDGLQLAVHNDGEGIAAHHIPRLTERFYRVDSHRSREVGGTGLGLAIVKHIVNRHRGRLMIESGKEGGTTITVTLPAFPPDDPASDA
ncbi:ATP-binding protein [Yoonia sp. R2331]|uniref:ATP-binding protein n=1 Tax=Yoonia sp. R2331 TaxID=3237238 RepID=UPI0034E3EB4C